jgi:uncharacterized protein YggE
MMMKMRLVVLALALLPVAASAQAPLAPPFRVPGSAGGITVSGHGSVTVTAKTVQFIAQARGLPDEAGALAAMRAAGIDDPVVGPVGPQISSGNQAVLRGTIRGVTRAKLDRMGEAAASYVRAHPGSSLDNVVFNPVLDDCAASEQAARAAAMADARRKADALAALAGVSIDGVSAVNENGGCPGASDRSRFGGPADFDIGTLTSTIAVYENVTFAITPGTPSTRRRTL